ncbi:MAG: carbohydrate kinase family protein [Leptothrix sp. (in: Bacteria)]|nr:carbohydrate kinase family protein [Leptothrix sp. (in: b-proteobacteria)]
MPALICGSLAFDTITTFPGRFADQILPAQVHILNVSFLVPTLRREYGGCAGNIAYNLDLLGGSPVILAALGVDGGDYLARVQGWGADTSLILRDAELHTAQCHITTDRDNNQIAAFHPGAMSHAHQLAVPPRGQRNDLAIGIIAPDGRDAMWQHAHQMAEQGIPFIFDPGQQLPQFNGDEHLEILALARWVALNDYEARMLQERTGESPQVLSRRPNVQGVVVTLAEHGCEIWQAGERTQVPGVAAECVVDPTGCGDAFRAALLYGLERGWPLHRCAVLGNRLGALKIARRGPQNHVLDGEVRALLAR